MWGVFKVVSLKVKLFGTPLVFHNDGQVNFPYRKVEALFYYLIVNQQATRDFLVNLLWSEVSDELAKKNLRNAVYIIKKIFNCDVIISPQRSILMLNPNIIVDIDVNKFFQSDGESLIDIYKGEFLEGFLVKDAENFEEWMLAAREKYKDVFLSKLNREIYKLFQDKEYMLVEKYTKSLLKADELDEGAYRLLMQVYKHQSQYNKGIDIYHRLTEILQKELAISPDQKTIELLEEIVKEKSKAELANINPSKEFFYGRERELISLQENFQQFINHGGSRSTVVLGEAGIGKSKLIETFLKGIDSGRVRVLPTNCYQAEEGYLLKPWNGIFSKLTRHVDIESINIPITLKNIVGLIFPIFAMQDINENNTIENIDFLKYQVAEKAIIEIFWRISEKYKLILVFEDLQWIDDLSLSLLKNIIMENKNKNIMVVATCRNDFDNKINQFISDLSSIELLNRIELQRFNRKEVNNFAYGKLPTFQFTEELKELMYQETEGNTFFLVEFLNNIVESENSVLFTTKMQDILKSRFLNVSEEAKKILSIASVFFDKVTLVNLQDVSDKNDLELMDILEELQKKQILKEIDNNLDIEYAFTHQKLREYIYSQLTISRRKILHSRIAILLEKKLKNDKRDIFLYSKLIYHFTNCGNRLKALKYTIKNMEEFLNLNHEIFPVLNDDMLQGKISFNYTQAPSQLKEIQELIEVIRQEEEFSDELQSLEMLFLHILGRYHIRQGEYDNGLKMIQQVIDKSLDSKEYWLSLKAYRQKIYYCINTHQTELMGKTIEMAIKIAVISENKEDMGILLRLKGLLKIMLGEYDKGEELLKQSIEIFDTKQYREKYLLNIAAAYNYIGEGKRKNKQFLEALKYYNQAINFCEDKKITRGLPIFCTNAGQANYDIGNYTKAKEYFYKALQMTTEFDSVWGRSTAHGYLSLILVKEGKYHQALEEFKKAIEDANKLKNPYENGLINKVMAEISEAMKYDAGLREMFKNYIDKSHQFYCYEGIRLMENIKGCYEVEILKNLIGKA